jgi:hypothetical protein
VVLVARELVGLKVAVTPAWVTTPVTDVAPCFSLKVAVVIVRGSIASLKAAAMFPPIAAPVAAFTGTVKLTVGAVLSTDASVVKLQTKSAARALPARSAAPVVIVAV